MFRMLPIMVFALTCAAPVSAFGQTDAGCSAEIRALFDGGGLDPFAVPPNRRQLDVMGADGALSYTMDSIVISPIHQISGIRGNTQFILMMDGKTWMGPSMEGPWNDSGMVLGEDVIASHHAIPASMAKNVTDAECLGVVDTENGSRLHYKFRTKVDPQPARGDAWWGAYNEIWIDPENGLPVVWEMSEHISSWHEGIKEERHVISIVYDDSLTIDRPE